jgi:hypothetical protein
MAQTRSLPAGPTTADDLWQCALMTLTCDEQAQFKASESTDRLTLLKDVHAAAEGKKKEALEKRWKVSLRGRHVILRDLFEKIVVWIEVFKGIGDQAVSCAPQHAALPWYVRSSSAKSSNYADWPLP